MEQKQIKHLILITGANRGIGLELVKQYLAMQFKVLATCREPDNALALLNLQSNYPENLLVEQLELSDASSIQEFTKSVTARRLKVDLLINNAGFLDRQNQSIKSIDYSAAQQSISVNALGPLYLIHQLLAVINNERGKIVVVSSDMGSLSIPQPSAWFGYRMSKAAVNMLVHNLSSEFNDQKIAVFAIHPGWVQTDMGGAIAKQTTESSAKGIIKTIDSLGKAQCGGFFNFDGQALPF